MNPGPHSPWQMFLPLCFVPLVHTESWAPPLRRGAWQPGPWLVREARGGQEADPRDRGSLSACRWAGRPGLCGPAQGLSGCKLIRQLLRLPRRWEQLESPAQARKWKLRCESCTAVLPWPCAGRREAAAELLPTRQQQLHPADRTSCVLVWAHRISRLLWGGWGGIAHAIAFIYSSIHSFNKYLLSSYCVPVLGPGDIAGNKTGKNPCSRGAYILKQGDTKRGTDEVNGNLGPVPWGK